MRNHMENALAVAKYLETEPRVEKVLYPGRMFDTDWVLRPFELKDVWFQNCRPILNTLFIRNRVKEWVEWSLSI